MQLYVVTSSKNIVLLPYSTRANPTHRKLQNLDPTQPDPTPRSTQPMDNSDLKDTAVSELTCIYVNDWLIRPFRLSVCLSVTPVDCVKT